MPSAPDLVGYLEAGLKGTRLRQALIANNLANLDTPAFRRNDTMFERTLSEAIESGKPADLDESEAWIFTPATTPVAPNGNDVDLDMEVGQMIKNVSLYKTYIRLLGRTYKQMDLAMRDSMV